MFSTDIIYEVVTFSIGDTKSGTKMGKLQLKDPNTNEFLNCILWEEALNRMDSKLFRCGNQLRIVSGSFNEKYCKWCWVDGEFAQNCTIEEMVEHCVPLMPLGQTEPEACRTYMRGLLPTLERWKQK